MPQTPFQLPLVKVEPNEHVSVSFAGRAEPLEFASVAEATLTFDAIVYSLNRQAMARLRGEA